MLDAATWIIDFLHTSEDCRNGMVMRPDMETWIFGFLHHAKGCCDGAVICFVMGLLPC
jgi:hypothetical protein